MRFKIQLPLLLLLLSFLPPAVTIAQTFTVEVIRVIDGDTIKVDFQGQPESIRLIGIDTPECRVNGKANFQEAAREARKQRRGLWE